MLKNIHLYQTRLDNDVINEQSGESKNMVDSLIY